jgi:Tol biopolymer transport system component
MERSVRLSGSQRLVLLTLIAALLVAAAVGVLLLAGARLKPLLGGNGAIVVDVASTLYRIEPGSSDPVVLPIGLGHAYSPTFSPDGTRLAFVTRAGATGPFSIWVAKSDGTDARSVTGAMEVQGGELAGLAWAPDAKSIVFASIKAGGNRLYTVRADGTDVRALPDSDDSRTWPSISPDGAWLAYQVQPLSGDVGKTSLGLSRVDGSDARILLSVDASDASFAGSQWAPDSSRLAYFRSGGRSHTVAIADLTGREVVVSRPDEDAFNPVWSPDGTRLLYATESSGVVVVDLASSARQIIPKGYAECGAVWAPDGSAVLGLGASCTDLFRIPLANPAATVRLPVPTGSINTASWQAVTP